MAVNAINTQNRYGCIYPLEYGCKCQAYLSRYGCVILEDMAVNVTHTQEDMIVLSLRIWLQMPHILQQIWLCYH